MLKLGNVRLSTGGGGYLLWTGGLPTLALDGGGGTTLAGGVDPTLAGGYLPWLEDGRYLPWPEGYQPWLGGGGGTDLCQGYLLWLGGYLPWMGDGVPTLDVGGGAPTVVPRLVRLLSLPAGGLSCVFVINLVTG